MKPVNSERGAAAVEMALFAFLLVALMGIVGPLLVAVQEQVRLGRASGAAVRFATATPETKRTDCTGAPMARDRRPSSAQVQVEAVCARYGAFSAPADDNFVVDVSADPRSVQPGQEISVTVSNDVDLGVLGAFMGRESMTLSSTSVGIKE